MRKTKNEMQWPTEKFVQQLAERTVKCLQTEPETYIHSISDQDKWITCYFTSLSTVF